MEVTVCEVVKRPLFVGFVFFKLPRMNNLKAKTLDNR